MTSPQVGKARLLRLANILDVADAAHRASHEPTYNQRCLRHECGTPACAIGHWAAHERSRWVFKRGDGVRLKASNNMISVPNLMQDAATDFAITQLQAIELFENEGCGNARTAHQAALYIRKFVKENLSESARNLR